MEKDEKLEGNKLIAEFMGLGAQLHLIEHPKTNEYVEAEYDKSWDWLMPVVEKIISIKLIDNINECNYIYIGFDYEDNSHYVNLYCGEDIQLNGLSKNSKIEAVYNAVIEFIKWYNENNLTNE